MRLLGAHANILGVNDLFCDVRDNALYIAMELLDSDLHRIIQSPQDLTDAHHRFFMRRGRADVFARVPREDDTSRPTPLE